MQRRYKAAHRRRRDAARKSLPNNPPGVRVSGCRSLRRGGAGPRLGLVQSPIPTAGRSFVRGILSVWLRVYTLERGYCGFGMAPYGDVVALLLLGDRVSGEGCFQLHVERDYSIHVLIFGGAPSQNEASDTTHLVFIKSPSFPIFRRPHS